MKVLKFVGVLALLVSMSFIGKALADDTSSSATPATQPSGESGSGATTAPAQ